MVHSFKYTTTNNGNINLSFMEDSKKRSIIFTKDTPAYIHFITTNQAMFDMSYHEDYKGDNQYIKTIQHMRKIGYVFKANPNNKSIFRPIIK